MDIEHNLVSTFHVLGFDGWFRSVGDFTDEEELVIKSELDFFFATNGIVFGLNKNELILNPVLNKDASLVLNSQKGLKINDPDFAVKFAIFLFSKFYDLRNDRTFHEFHCDVFLTNLIAHYKINLQSFNFSIDKFCGFSYLKDGKFTIVVNNSLYFYRRNFTIAHEIAHFFLHKNQKRIFIDNSENILNSVSNPMEIEANIFASELVLPHIVILTMLKKGFDFNKISATTKTSHECLRFRLHRLLKQRFGISNNESVEMVKKYENAWLNGDEGGEELFILVRSMIVRK